MNKLTSLALVLAVATATAGSAEAWPGKKKVEPAPAPAPVPVEVAPPPPPTEVKLASRFIEFAAAYGGYMERAASIHADYIDGPGVANALRTGESFEPKQLQQGMVAYAAVVALKDPAFVNQMRTYAANQQAREAIAAQLMADPNYVSAIPGADTAAGLVVAALAGQGSRVNAAGVAVKQSAYDIQHQNWSKSAVENRDARLQQAKLLSSTPLVISEADRSRVVSIPMSTPGAVTPIAGPYTPSVARGLTLAALAVLGKAGEENADQLNLLLVNNQDAFCFSMSKLNLYQCLAVAKPHYEDVFCLGQHVLLDTAQCVMKSAGTPLAPAGAPMAPAVVAAVAPLTAASMSTPHN